MGYDKLIHENVIIEYVALIDGLKHNLLSITQFCNKDVQILFGNDYVITNQHDGVIME